MRLGRRSSEAISSLENGFFLSDSITSPVLSLILRRLNSRQSSFFWRFLSSLCCRLQSGQCQGHCWEQMSWLGSGKASLPPFCSSLFFISLSIPISVSVPVIRLLIVGGSSARGGRIGLAFACRRSKFRSRYTGLSGRRIAGCHDCIEFGNFMCVPSSCAERTL